MITGSCDPKNEIMNPLTRNLSFQIYRTQHLTNYNSVTSLHLPISSSSSAATLLRGRTLLYIRPRTPAAAAQRDQQRSMAAEDARIAGIASAIRVIPDFPKPGTHTATFWYNYVWMYVCIYVVRAFYFLFCFVLKLEGGFFFGRDSVSGYNDVAAGSQGVQGHDWFVRWEVQGQGHLCCCGYDLSSSWFSNNSVCFCFSFYKCTIFIKAQTMNSTYAEGLRRITSSQG